jgi:hypothetical protein
LTAVGPRPVSSIVGVRAKHRNGFPFERMNTQGLPTVVPFDKRHGFGSTLALPGSPNGDPKRHRLSFSTASVSRAVGFSLAGRACGFAKPWWHPAQSVRGGSRCIVEYGVHRSERSPLFDLKLEFPPWRR